MKITIRPAKVSDAESVHRWGMSMPELWTDDKNKFYDLKTLKEWISNPRGDVLLVAEVDGRPVGMSFAYTLRSWGFMDSFAVDPAYQGNGIGEKLFDATVEAFRGMGMHSVELTVQVQNKKAIGLYTRKGFTKGYPLDWMIKVIE